MKFPRTSLPSTITVTLLLWMGVGPAMASGWLGVTIEPPRGVQVGEVIKGSPADQGGIVRGDIILHAAGNEIRSMAQFIQTIANTPAGTEISLTLVRQGKEMTVTVKLEESGDHQSVSQNFTNRWRQGSPFSNDAVPPRFGGRPDFGPPFPLSERFSDQHPPRGAGTPWLAPPASAWLGIAPGNATGGVAILGVAPHSPSERGGLKKGDIIVSVNNKAVGTPAALVRLIGTMQPGDQVEIAVNRDGQTKTIPVQLEKTPSHTK